MIWFSFHGHIQCLEEFFQDEYFLFHCLYKQNLHTTSLLHIFQPDFVFNNYGISLLFKGPCEIAI